MSLEYEPRTTVTCTVAHVVVAVHLYVGGECMGGADVAKEIFDSGELYSPPFHDV